VSLTKRALRKRLFDYVDEIKTLSGTADIDISESDYTGYITLLTVSPVNEPLEDLVIDLAYNKATTGVSDVATNADTLDVAIFAETDGTNSTAMIINSTQVTLTGDVSPVITGQRFKVGLVDAGNTITVKVKLSAERADAEIPYKVHYKSPEAPTVAAVAAG
jgi:hypothetical protein